jgi:hypothetical protein
MLSEHFTTKVSLGDILKVMVWRENLHETRNVNGVYVLDFATSESLIVKDSFLPL